MDTLENLQERLSTLTACAGLEGIAFNMNSSFREKMIQAVKDVRKDFKDRKVKPTKAETYQPIADVIKDVLNMTVSMVGFDEPYNAYVYPPTLSKNNPVVHNFYEMYPEQYHKEIDGINTKDAKNFFRYSQRKIMKGGVDLKNARLEGDFAGLQVDMGISTWFFRDAEVPAAQVAAIIGHECGHAFYYFAYLQQSLVGNYILQELTSSILNTDDEKVRVDIVKKAVDLGYDIKEIQDGIVNAESKESLTAIVMNNERQRCKKELGFVIYDRRGFEMLADQFPARLGMGADITAFFKNQSVYDPFLNNKKTSVAFFIRMLFRVHDIINIIPIVAIGGAITIIAGFIGLLVDDDTITDDIVVRDTTYDQMEDRLDTIRQQYSKYLQTPSLSRKEKEKVLSDIRQMEVHKQHISQFMALGSIILEVIFAPSQRRAIMKQRNLEKLVNNRFGEIATELELS